MLAALLVSVPVALAAADSPGFLGLQVRTHKQGALVVTVFPATHAEAAGLGEGDLITHAGGQALAGLPIDEITATLKGDLDSELTITVRPFPRGAEPVQLEILRGPRPPGSEELKGSSFLPLVEREANRVIGTLRAGREVSLEGALTAWSREEDRGAADRALLRVLREADALGWATGSELTPAGRDAFWTALGSHEEARTFLVRRDPAARLAAASTLALHRGSAALASALLEGQPPQQAAPLLALAAAVAAGDQQAAAAAAVLAPDALDSAGWQAVFGPLPADRAALELHQAQAEQAPPLPAASLRRLERSGLVLPWPPGVEPGLLGLSEPPAAPRLEVARLDGGQLDLSEHSGPLVLSFWASWCGPCRQELPRLQELVARTDGALSVWAINIDKDRSAVRPMVDELGLTLPVGLAGSRATTDWGVRSVPRSFVLDSEQRIVLDHTGFSELGFAETEREIHALLSGEMAPQRALGSTRFGAEDLELAGTGPLQAELRLLLVDDQGGAWIRLRNHSELVPLRLSQGELSQDPDAAVPLPLPANLGAWVDLDGDGGQELLIAASAKPTLRAQRPDGRALWSARSTDGIAALGVHRGARGRPGVVLLRLGSALVDHPLGPKPGGEAREQVLEQRPRLEFLDHQGELLQTTALPSPVVNMAADPQLEQVLLLLQDGRSLLASADGSLQELDAGAAPLRRVQLLDLDGSSPRPVFTTHSARQLLQGGFGPGGAPSLVAITGAGDLHGLQLDGAHRFWLDLPRRPTLAVVDLDGDGRDELLLWAQNFGLAALQTAY